MCASCRTAQVPRIDLDPLLGSIGEVTAPPSTSSSELSPDQEVPWCGRSSELKALMTLAEQSLSRRQLRCFLVLGTPGLGKSRLLRELGRMIVRHLGVPKTRVLFATVPGEGAAAHSVFAELFHKRFAITAGESAQSARDKVLRTCRSLLPAVRATEVAHLLGDLLELPFPDSPVSSGTLLQPGRATPRLYSAIKRFLAADARRAPLLLLLDEMEHAGAETMSLMHYLLDGLQDLPVLIGLAARPEFTDSYPDFGTSTVVPERIELAALPAEDAIELLGAVVGADPEELPAPLVAHIGEAFDGSPRAVVELVRLLVETGALSWVPASDPMAAEDDQPLVPEWDSERLDKGELPTSFAGLVHARLQAMAAVPRAILEQAAIVGEHFYLGAVRMLARCDETRLGGELATDGEPSEPSEPSDPDGPPLDEVIEASERSDEESELLAQLQSQGVVLLLPSSQLRGEREYRFAYPPWQETIYRSIPPARRRRYHHLVAQWLQLCPEHDRQEVQEAIGRHLERASRGPDAARPYRRSAELATTRGAYNRAPRLLLRALACLEGTELCARLELWQELGNALWRLGDADAALPSFQKVVRLSYALSARTQAAQAFSTLGQIYRQKGDMSRAIENLARSLELHQQLGDQAGLGDALGDLGQALWLLGRVDEAIERSERALELRRRIGDRRKIAASLITIGIIEQHRGKLDAAVACFDEAQRKHEDDPLLHAACLEAQGSIDLIRGEVPLARARFEEALSLCEPMGPSAQLAGLVCRLGEALLQEGLLGEAESRLVQARELAFRLSDRRALAEILRLLGLIHFRRDDQKVALDYCHKALDRAQQSGLRYEIGRALLSLGEVHAATLFDVSSAGEHPAWEYFRRAVTLLREIGDQAELAMALAALGRHLIERGRRGPGRATLREAVQLGTELRMRMADQLQQMLAEL
jgi:tetratricopeptide (TPR) repeat protein